MRRPLSLRVLGARDDWLDRPICDVYCIITGWFVARNIPSIDVIEMVVSLLLIIFFLAVGAFWPYLVAWFAERRAARPTRARAGRRNIRPSPLSRDVRGQ